MSDPNQLDLPYRTVYGEKETFVKGFNTQADAEADAKERNERAKEMGIEATYTAIARP